MFTSIAPRYDLLNHVLSMNVDRLWWNRTARVFSEVLRRPDAQVLDLCCGTGDMTFALHRRAKSAPTRDHRRRLLARHAGARRRRNPEAGTFAGSRPTRCNLPFAAGQFQLVTSAFGFRNLANYDRGLAEIYRVLAPDGEVGILDFGEPKGLHRQGLSPVLPPRAAGHRHGDLGRTRAVRLPAGFGAALPLARRDAGTHARRRLPRRLVDAVYVRDCGAVSGKKRQEAEVTDSGLQLDIFKTSS